MAGQQLWTTVEAKKTSAALLRRRKKTVGLLTG